MPSPVITPNMFLTEPVVGNNGTLSPGWALLLNANFQTIDQHNHTTGLGVPIPPAGLDISSDLSFQGNNLLAVNSLVYNGAVSGTPDVLSTYTNGTDLFYKDINGTPIQLTNNGSPSSAVGNIQGLPSTPIGGAAIAWVNAAAGFRFLNDSGTGGANLDFGTPILRYPGSYPTPSGTNWVALRVPAAISAGYSLTLPLALPASQKFMTMDAAGNIAAPWTVDNSTLEVSGGTTLQVKALGITNTQLAVGAALANIGVNGLPYEDLAVPTNSATTFSSATVTSTGYTGLTGGSTAIVGIGRPVLVTVKPVAGAGPSFVSIANNVSRGSGNVRITVSSSGGGTEDYEFNFGNVFGGALATSNQTQWPLNLSFTTTPTAGTVTVSIAINVDPPPGGSTTSNTISSGVLEIVQM